MPTELGVGGTSHALLVLLEGGFWGWWGQVV